VLRSFQWTTKLRAVAVAMVKIRDHARPHPNPLPQEREGTDASLVGRSSFVPSPPLSCLLESACVATRHDRMPRRRKTILPLLGVRASVRLRILNAQFHRK